MDVFSKSKRSEIMSKIRSRDTKIELLFCRLLSRETYKLGFRYRKNYRKIPGSPDVVFVSNKVAIFVDGDFWHGKDFIVRSKLLPKKYWRAKIKRNIARDVEVSYKLKKMGWRVFRFWESDVKKNGLKKARIVSNYLCKMPKNE